MAELAALGAALCWSLTGMLATSPARALGPFAFGLYRQVTVTALLVVLVALGPGFGGVTPAQASTLAVSGLVGVFFGDTILFAALVRLGPRRAGALFALNAPMAALAGWAFLGEALPPQAWAGVALASLGVALAVLGRPGRSGGHAFEAIRGRPWVGIALGLLAAAGQAGGALIARPAMAAGADPLAASLIRVAVSAAALATVVALPWRVVRPHGPIDGRGFGLLAASGILGMGVGVTLLLFALSRGEVGIVSTLSALSPVLILPTLWVVTGERPSATSLLGALVAVAGMALIFLR